ncbi:18088_t:CDS:1, partial [Gigaspora margarita]
MCQFCDDFNQFRNTYLFTTLEEAQQFNIKHKELLKTIPKYNQIIINGSIDIINSQTKVTYLLYF